jgi:ribose-phosphate pyrophosphokinase
MGRGKLAIISGRSNIALATESASEAGVVLSACKNETFSDGEVYVEIGENVRGSDVFVIQSTSTPVNDHLMELLIIMDALRRASARRITPVLPYFGYARQDRKTQPRVPITAKLVSDLIFSAGANRVLTMDLHAGQIMGFFNIPVDNLYAMPILIRYLRENYGDENIAIVSPDSGGVPRARSYAKKFDDASLAIIDKRRSGANEVAEMNVVGDVRGKVAIIVDDIIDTGGTVMMAANALLEKGATDVVACCAHAVLSGNSKTELPKSKVSKVIVTDSIYHTDIEQNKDWLVQLSVAPLIGEAIKRIHNEDSVSSLFEVDD